MDIVRRRRSAAGYEALVVTVDSAYFGLRERLGFTATRSRRRRPRCRPQLSSLPLTWDAVVRDQRGKVGGIPVIPQGIRNRWQKTRSLARVASRLCRRLDLESRRARTRSSPRQHRDAQRDRSGQSAGRVPVIVDGGFYRGTDVVKALLALGATAVANGRIYTMALRRRTARTGRRAQCSRSSRRDEERDKLTRRKATTVAQLTLARRTVTIRPRHNPVPLSSPWKRALLARCTNRSHHRRTSFVIPRNRLSRGTTIRLERCVYADRAVLPIRSSGSGNLQRIQTGGGCTTGASVDMLGWRYVPSNRLRSG